VCDVGDERQGAAAVERTLAHFGRLDLLVNNAGTLAMRPLDRVERAELDASLAVHVLGPLAILRAALPALERSRGRIVNVSAVEGLVGVPRLGATVAGKFALVGLSECARAEWWRRGVRLTLVCPGFIRDPDTAATRQAWGPRWLERLARSPITSVSRGRAARRILDASERGRARLVLTPAARLLVVWSALAPGSLAWLAARVEARLWRGAAAPGNTHAGG
jgi:NAD(P)-dependent dehydrogenase (short-subunit alcohol dehydrogenase family)